MVKRVRKAVERRDQFRTQHERLAKAIEDLRSHESSPKSPTPGSYYLDDAKLLDDWHMLLVQKIGANGARYHFLRLTKSPNHEAWKFLHQCAVSGKRTELFVRRASKVWNRKKLQREYVVQSEQASDAFMNEGDAILNAIREKIESKLAAGSDPEVLFEQMLRSVFVPL